MSVVVSSGLILSRLKFERPRPLRSMDRNVGTILSNLVIPPDVGSTGCCSCDSTGPPQVAKRRVTNSANWTARCKGGTAVCIQRLFDGLRLGEEETVETVQRGDAGKQTGASVRCSVPFQMQLGPEFGPDAEAP